MTNYEKYQLQWMIDHDCTIEDLIILLARFQNSIGEYKKLSLDNLFSIWEQERGFDGMIWACKREWEDTEAKYEPFVKVSWCNEDIAAALNDAGFKATEDAIDFVRTLCKEDDLVSDRMCEAGWDVINNYIAENKEEFEPKDEDGE